MGQRASLIRDGRGGGVFAETLTPMTPHLILVAECPGSFAQAPTRWWNNRRLICCNGTTSDTVMPKKKRDGDWGHCARPMSIRHDVDVVEGSQIAAL